MQLINPQLLTVKFCWRNQAYFFDKKCEQLAFPKMFFKVNSGHIFLRECYLTPTKYFNQLLLSYSEKLASNSNQIFFAQCVTSEKIKLSSQYGYDKMSGRITAGVFANQEESVKHFASHAFSKNALQLLTKH